MKINRRRGGEPVKTLSLQLDDSVFEEMELLLKNLFEKFGVAQAQLASGKKGNTHRQMMTKLRR